MAHRRFVDRSGREWEVWSVNPTKAGPEMAKGWLCFESAGEKRRLAPFPRSWEGLDDRDLPTLLAAATPSKRNTPPGGMSIDDPQ